MGSCHSRLSINSRGRGERKASVGVVIDLENGRGSLLGLRVTGSTFTKVVCDPGRTVQLKRPGAGLTYCFLHTQACSTEERKRDFEKIFAHYDVVSVSFWVVLATCREQACLAPLWGHPTHRPFTDTMDSKPTWALPCPTLSFSL